MVQFRAVAARSASSKARRFMTGSEPGRPRHTGHVAEFGGSPNCVLQPQNSFVFVRSCTWTSRPMTMRLSMTLQLRPFRVPIGLALEHAGHAEQSFLGNGRGQDLQADRQVPLGEPARNTDPRQTGE